MAIDPDLVPLYRERFARREVSMRQLAREAGVTHQAIEPMLRGRTYRYCGGPFAHIRVKPTQAERLCRKIRLTPGCWIWTGAVASHGYGKFWLDSRNPLAHRASYELFVGPIPDDMELDHLCRNPRCVNPEHLEPVTAKVNSYRGIGPAADNARKTHCKRGHEYTGDNVRLDAKGRRVCRPCMAYLNRRWRSRSGVARGKAAR